MENMFVVLEFIGAVHDLARRQIEFAQQTIRDLTRHPELAQSTSAMKLTYGSKAGGWDIGNGEYQNYEAGDEEQRFLDDLKAHALDCFPPRVADGKASSATFPTAFAWTDTEGVYRRVALSPVS